MRPKYLTSMEKAHRPNTQEARVLEILKMARDDMVMSRYVKDGWVNKQYFIRVMMLTQVGRAIWNLENKMGLKIEHSEFTDEFGFKSYRLQTKETLF